EERNVHTRHIARLELLLDRAEPVPELLTRSLRFRVVIEALEHVASTQTDDEQDSDHTFSKHGRLPPRNARRWALDRAAAPGCPRLATRPTHEIRVVRRAVRSPTNDIEGSALFVLLRRLRPREAVVPAPRRFKPRESGGQPSTRTRPAAGADSGARPRWRAA